MIYPPLADIVDTIQAVNSYFLGFVLSICALMVAYGGYLWLASGFGDPVQAHRGKHYIRTGLIASVLFVLANWLSSALFKSIQEQVPPQPSNAPQPPSLPTTMPTIPPVLAVGSLIVLIVAAVVITNRTRKVEKETDTSSPASTPENTSPPALPEPGLKQVLLTPEMRGHLLDEALEELAHRPQQLFRDGQWGTSDFERWADALNQAKVEIDSDALFQKAKAQLDAYALQEMSEAQLQQKLQRLRAGGKTAMLRRARAIYKSQQMQLEGQLDTDEGVPIEQ